MLRQKNGIALVVGIAAQLSLTGAALAQWTPQTLKVQAADPNDIARTNNGRLRKTRYAETNEQAVVHLFADGKTGLFVEMHSGAINGTKPVHRQQVACTPIQLTQNADGSVGATANAQAAKFVTDNVGQDYRNGNKPELVPINGGQNMLLMFNYRVQGENDTKRYVKVLDAQCNEVPITDANGNAQKQIVVMEKQNDNCDMHQSGEGPCDVAQDANGTTHVTCWAGCNGNGKDDGWLNDVTVACQNGTAGATGCQVTKNFDVSLCKNEERSRGRCSIAEADPNTAVCTWTEGNDQPQTDGTWIAAVDISAGGQQGPEAQTRVLWKKQIEGEKRIEGVRTWSVRANSSRILTENPDGTLARSNQLFIYTSDLRGNNTNNRKGGRYLQQNIGVVQADKTGLKWIVNMTDVTTQMLGIDATHLTVAQALVQDANAGKTVPALTFLQGSQNGGQAPADLKVLGVDVSSQKFIDYGVHPAGGVYDRHLYSNYLGGNPGNQGRNFAGAQFVKNPFFSSTAATSPKYLMLHALTGKASEDVANPAIKPSSFLSIVPMMNPKDTPPPPAGMPASTTTAQNGSGGGQNAQPQAGDPPMPSAPSDPGASGSSDAPMAPSAPASTPMASAGNFSGGCSMSGGSTSADLGSVALLLIGFGIVLVARRKRA